MEQQTTRTRTGRPIRAYIYNFYGALSKPANSKWCSFRTLEEGLAKFNEIRPRYEGKQILFIDYSVSPSKIIHILEQQV